MKETLVTIIIPSYNHEKYIAKAITSVLEQTYKNIELIVIDDGSKDNSVQVIQALADKHKFTFIAQENQSLPVTLNRALEIARGELFCEFSSDDFLSETYIELQVHFMHQNPDIALVAASLTIVDAEDRAQPKKHTAAIPQKFNFEDVIFKGKNVPAPGMVFRKDILQEVGGFSPDIQLEDLQIQLKLTNAGHLITFNPDAEVFYRLHGENNVLRESWMADQMLATINEYQDHKDFKKIRKFWYLKLFKKYAKVDKKKARRFLPQVLQYCYHLSFLHAVYRLVFKTVKSCN